MDRNIKLTEIAWLAGILEGEGCFMSYALRKNSIRISLGMSDLDIVERVKFLMDSGQISVAVREGFKTMYMISVGSHKAAGVMMTIYPFMGQRRQDKIRECLDSWKNAPLRNSSKTECINGHAYSDENTRYNLRGNRACLTCDATNARKYRAKSVSKAQSDTA